MKIQNNNMRILITGGAGFIGSTLAEGLAADGYSITALDNLKRRGSELNLPALLRAGVRFCHGDVRCPEDLEAAGDCDLLIECSAEASVLAGCAASPAYLLNANIVGLINCLEYARSRKAGIIFLSTSRVYSLAALRELPLRREADRFTPEADYVVAGFSGRGIAENFSLSGSRSLYGASKLAGELLVEEYGAMYGLPWVINRCGVVAGPRQMGMVEQGFTSLWFARHCWGGPLEYRGFGGAGLQVRDVLHVADLLDLIRLQAAEMATYGGRAWNVGGGLENSVSLLELTRLCREVSGNAIPISSAPESHPVDIPWYVTDNAAITVHSGWRPQRTLLNLLRDTHEWLTANKESLFPLFHP